jgi:hypothetical protein
MEIAAVPTAFPDKKKEAAGALALPFSFSLRSKFMRRSPARAF